jgi:hypothetical protein
MLYWLQSSFLEFRKIALFYKNSTKDLFILESDFAYLKLLCFLFIFSIVCVMWSAFNKLNIYIYIPNNKEAKFLSIYFFGPAIP